MESRDGLADGALRGVRAPHRRTCVCAHVCVWCVCVLRYMCDMCMPVYVCGVSVCSCMCVCTSMLMYAYGKCVCAHVYV